MEERELSGICFFFLFMHPELNAVLGPFHLVGDTFHEVFVCLCVCVCVHLNASTYGVQRSQISMELEIQMVHWVLVTEFVSS